MLRGESLRNAAEAGIRAVLVNYMKLREGKKYNAAVFPAAFLSLIPSVSVSKSEHVSNTQSQPKHRATTVIINISTAA